MHNETQHKEEISARYGFRVSVEHKVVFYINGKKHGFRCDDDTLKALEVEEGQEIPMMPNAWYFETDHSSGFQRLDFDSAEYR